MRAATTAVGNRSARSTPAWAARRPPSTTSAASPTATSRRSSRSRSSRSAILLGAGAAQPGRPAVPDRSRRALLPGGAGPVRADLSSTSADSGGLMFSMPFLMFIFLLALGEDYNILVMTRIREEAQQLPLRDAVTRALGATGTTVTSAGLVLAGTFGVLRVAGGGSGGDQIRRHRPGPGPRHPDGHLPGAHPAGALDRGAAGPLELVAVPDEQAGCTAARAPAPGRRRAGPGCQAGARPGRPRWRGVGQRVDQPRQVPQRGQGRGDHVAAGGRQFAERGPEQPFVDLLPAGDRGLAGRGQRQ